MDATVGITYKVFLANYPKRQEFGLFVVSFTLLDECDARLVDQGFRDPLTEICPGEKPPEEAPPEPTVEELE